MAEHLRKNEAELNDLLSEYWALRHQTGSSYFFKDSSVSNCFCHILRGIHGDPYRDTGNGKCDIVN